ncbi:hypothetical protein TWF696_003346 [Orbilia brochopaga]|uniref:HNH nuclease domain-containing protein n=1 Tax=Orbilia brochopaga TaxID=3140254 RepID=A0AAV9TXP9_9PEZI
MSHQPGDDGRALEPSQSSPTAGKGKGKSKNQPPTRINPRRTAKRSVDVLHSSTVASAAGADISTKRPKRAKNGATQQASEDENDEDADDYKTRSPERTEVLTAIKAQIPEGASPAFWAACHLGDLENVRALIMSNPRQHCMTQLCNHETSLLPIQWTQKHRDRPGTTSPKTPDSSDIYSTSSARKVVPSSCPQKDSCLRRDGACILTGYQYPEVAHIFPHYLLNPPSADSTSKAYVPRLFWHLSALFWKPDRIARWRKKIFPHANNPTLREETCVNLVCLAPTVHDMWNRGVFALKPLVLSPDQKELTVKFFWQPQYNHKAGDHIDLLTEPLSSRGLKNDGSGNHLTCYRNGSVCFIESGDVFTLKTKDPQAHPLPGWDLLEMQWVFQRLAAMTGAAGWSESHSDEDDGGVNLLPADDVQHFDWDRREGIYDWISTNEDREPFGGLKLVLG